MKKLIALSALLLTFAKINLAFTVSVSGTCTIVAGESADLVLSVSGTTVRPVSLLLIAENQSTSTPVYYEIDRNALVISVSPEETTKYYVHSCWTNTENGEGVGSAIITVCDNNNLNPEFNLPEMVCYDYGPIKLTDYITGDCSGFSFEGMGIYGNVFYPAIAGIGMFSIDVIYNGMTVATSAVTVVPIPEVSFYLVEDNISINGNPIPLNGYPSGGTYSGPGIKDGVFYPALAGVGIHQIVYTVNNGVCSNSATCFIKVYSDNATSEYDYDIRIYPNPVKDNLYISGSVLPDKVELYSLSGILLKSSVSGHVSFVPLCDLPNGIYMLKIFVDGNVMTQKIVK